MLLLIHFRGVSSLFVFAVMFLWQIVILLTLYSNY